MGSWPTSPIIRIIEARTFSGIFLRDTYAFRDSAGDYLSDGATLMRPEDESSDGDLLSKWEDITPVPTADLERLRDEFRGAVLSSRRLSSLLQVTSHVTPPIESPLDQAVRQVETSLSGSMARSDSSHEEYLALLMSAVSDFQGLEEGPNSPERGEALTRIVRLSVEWVSKIVFPGKLFTDREVLEVLDEVQARVESDPAIGGFAAMAVQVGEAASWVDGAEDTDKGRKRLTKGLPDHVLTLAQYALALLSECFDGDV